MSFIEQHSIPIFFALLFIILLLVAVIILLYKKINCSSNDGDKNNSDCVSKNKHKEILEDRDSWRKKYEELEKKCDNSESRNPDISDYFRLQDDYEKACVEIGRLNSKIDDLTRDKNELNELYDKSTKRREAPPTFNKQEKKESLSKIGSQVIRYASFPRSADSNNYFSDLTEGRADDSFFELKISEDTGEAIFRPLDFMKIRNYDPAMAAMTTEGVKPNMASTILGIEPGKAHLEGKDWIIDKPATIKLA